MAIADDRQTALNGVRPFIRALVARRCSEGSVKLNRDDLLQECMIEVSQSWDGYHPDGSRGGWRGYAIRVAENTINTLLKTEMRRTEIAPTGYLEDSLREPSVPFQDYDDLGDRLSRLLAENDHRYDNLRAALLAVCRNMERIARIALGEVDPKRRTWDSFGLNNSEIEVLKASFSCQSDERIAKQLNIHVRTVQGKRSRAYRKFGLTEAFEPTWNRTHALLMAYRLAESYGLVDPPRIGEDLTKPRGDKGTK